VAVALGVGISVLVAVAVAARVRVGVAICGRVDVGKGVGEGIAVRITTRDSESSRNTPSKGLSLPDRENTKVEMITAKMITRGRMIATSTLWLPFR
jgi:hypothetical protein